MLPQDGLYDALDRAALYSTFKGRAVLVGKGGAYSEMGSRYVNNRAGHKGSAVPKAIAVVDGSGSAVV